MQNFDTARRWVIALVTITMALTGVAGCGGSESSAPAESATPTPTAAITAIASPPTSTPVTVPTSTTTPERAPSATATAAAAPTRDATATATAQTPASPTPVPPTPAPTATPTSPPATPTSPPAPTPTATSTSTPTVETVPTVRCSITPTGPVAVGASLLFEAFSSPTDIPVQFSFDHGDGTIDPGARSDAYFAAPGSYRVTMSWIWNGHGGTVDCGTVTVTISDGCWIGLGPADGLGWWCGNVWCPGEVRLIHPGPARPLLCPDEPPWGCYIGMDGQPHCIPRANPTPTPRPTECLLGAGPADELGWWCDNRWCDQHDPAPKCPRYPIYGCFPTVDGQTICIDPGPSIEEMSCTVSDHSIEVGEIITLRAHWVGPEVPIDVVFNHGDGTRDPRWTAQAYYDAPGSYTVTLDWTMFGTTETEHCGTVTVT